ncbi:hypothetical protein D9M68_982150 [compost metagenome]
MVPDVSVINMMIGIDHRSSAGLLFHHLQPPPGVLSEVFPLCCIPAVVFKIQHGHKITGLVFYGGKVIDGLYIGISESGKKVVRAPDHSVIAGRLPVKEKKRIDQISALCGFYNGKM